MIHTEEYSDRQAFREIMETLSEYYGKERPTNRVLLMYFEALTRFTLEEVRQAVSKHLESPDQGRFFPKIADFKHLLEGGDITPDMIIAAARLKRSPLGVLAKIHIGSWDMNNLDNFALRQRAIECLELLPDWREKAANGDYSDHEIKIMLEAKIDPTGPFTNGIAGPKEPQVLLERAKVIGQAEATRKSLEHKPEPRGEPVNPEQQKEIIKRIRSMLV